MADAANATKWGQELQHPGNRVAAQDPFFTGDEHIKPVLDTRNSPRSGDRGGYAPMEVDALIPNLQLFMEGKQSAADSLKKAQVDGDRILKENGCRECSWACRGAAVFAAAPVESPGNRRGLHRRRLDGVGDAVERLAEVLLGIGVRQPQVALAGRAEAGARQRRDTVPLSRRSANSRLVRPVPVMFGKARTPPSADAADAVDRVEPVDDRSRRVRNASRNSATASCGPVSASARPLHRHRGTRDAVDHQLRDRSTRSRGKMP